jgi:hypothetical protein
VYQLETTIKALAILFIKQGGCKVSLRDGAQSLLGMTWHYL